MACTHLNRPIRTLRTQPIRPIITHGHLIAQAPLDLAPPAPQTIHLPRRLPDQQPQHLHLGRQLHERKLHRLIRTQLLPERLPSPRIPHALLDAEGRGTQTRGGLADAVFVHEGLGDGEAAVKGPEEGRGGDEDVGEGDGGVIGWHVEGPLVALDEEAGGDAGDDEGGDAGGGSGGAGGAGEDDAVGGAVHVGLPHLGAVDEEAGLSGAGFGDGARLHARGVAAVARFRQAEGEAVFPVESAGDVFFLLRFRAVAEQHDDVREVADDAVFVLQVVEQA